MQIYPNVNLLNTVRHKEQISRRDSSHNLEDPTGLKIYSTKVNVRFFSNKKCARVYAIGTDTCNHSVAHQGQNHFIHNVSNSIYYMYVHVFSIFAADSGPCMAPSKMTDSAY